MSEPREGRVEEGDGAGSAGAVVEVGVKGLHCGGCVARLTKILENQPGVSRAEVSLIKQEARLTLESEGALAGALDAIEGAGFYPDRAGQGSSGS